MQEGGRTAVPDGPDRAGAGRVLQVFFVVDCSGSMTGEPIEAVRQGMKTLLSELKSDPQALETVWMSVITFDSGANQVMPLTELLMVQEPTFEARGTTALATASGARENARYTRSGTGPRSPSRSTRR